MSKYDHNTIVQLKANRKMCPVCKSMNNHKKLINEMDCFVCQCGHSDPTFIDL